MPLPMQLAREMIAYQTDGFKAKLRAAIDALLKLPSVQAAEDSKELHALEKLIKNRTGVNIILQLNPPGFGQGVNAWPAIDVRFINAASVLRWSPSLGEYSPGIIDAMQKKRGAFVGSVDYKNGRLTGDYTKIDAYVLFGWNVMTLHIRDPDEIGALIMHEVGHAWTIMATSWMTSRACYFMAGIRNTLMRKNGDSITHVIKELGEVMVKDGLIESTSDISALSQMHNYDAMIATVQTAVYRKAAIEMGTLASSSRQTETLADTFATRFGYGVEIARAVRSFEEGKAYAATAMATASAISGILISSTGAGAIALAAGIAAASIFFGGHTKNGTDLEEIYGSDENRINRIRLSLIDALKDKNIDPSLRSDLLAQEKAVRAFLSDAQKGKSLLGDVANMLIPHKRATAAAIQLEEHLEKLAANDLYVGGNALRSAANL